MPFARAAEYASRLTRAEREQFWAYQCMPPNVRGRRREARRWIDLLTVLTGNRRLYPGDDWMSLDESRAIWFEAHARLRERDATLALAVERLRWEETSRDVAGTLDEWKSRVTRDGPRLDRLRSEMRQYGPYPLGRERIWAALGV